MTFRLVLPLAFFIAHGGAALAADAGNLVVARPGALPILLTAPHGGRDAVPGVPARTSGTLDMDAHTLELSEALAQHLQRALGARPYLVAARFNRRFVDANRADHEAFESPQAKPAYEAYHASVRGFVAQMKARFPRGAVLLDIHGQSADPAVVHRGTRNGATVAALLGKHGEAALTGPQSIFGALQRKGFEVFPGNTPIGHPPEHRRFLGGFTVHTYGSGKPDGIDAIQVEVGRDLRRDARFIAALGDAIAGFCRTYLAGCPAPR